MDWRQCETQGDIIWQSLGRAHKNSAARDSLTDAVAVAVRYLTTGP